MNRSSDTNYALITGASMGIGKALANECASRGMNILLISLPDQKLKETAEEMAQKYNVTTHYLEIDLTLPDSPSKIFDWCRDKGFKVNILINNAGAGGTTIFESSPLEYSDLRIQLNIRALVLLCQLFIPDMKNMDRAYILNVGSMSAYYAIPYKSVYSASKAFVVSFTTSVNEELRYTGIKMSVVNPNGVSTTEGTESRIKAHGAKGKLTQMPVDKLAKYTISKMFKGKTVIVPGRINRFVLAIGSIIPRKSKQRMLAKEFRKEIESDTILN